MSPLSFIPGVSSVQLILGGVILAGVAAGVVYYGSTRYDAGVAATTTTLTAKFGVEKKQWADQQAVAVNTAVKAVQDRLIEAQRRVAEQDGIIDDAKQKTVHAVAAATAASRNAASLRDQLAQFVASATAGGGGHGDPTAADGSEATGIRVLAQLFTEASDAATAMAAEADARDIAGTACERSYASLKASTAASAASAAN